MRDRRDLRESEWGVAILANVSRNSVPSSRLILINGINFLCMLGVRLHLYYTDNSEVIPSLLIVHFGTCQDEYCNFLGENILFLFI
jgi:hypothetical protein